MGRTGLWARCLRREYFWKSEERRRVAAALFYFPASFRR